MSIWGNLFNKKQNNEKAVSEADSASGKRKEDKEQLLLEIESLKDKMGNWQVSLGKWTQGPATHGYWFNDEEYIVYSNNVGGRQNVWLRTKDETEALEVLLEHVRAQAETQSKLEALKENAQARKDGANDDVPSFALGIEGSAGLNDSDCLVVWGAVKGHISKGMAGYLSSPWVDDDKILLTEVVEIEISTNGEMHQISEIENGRAGICLKKAGNFSVKPGSVF